MVISHNMLALNANRQFNIINKNKAKSIEKLSSGYRINRAADDAAGLSISEKMRRQIRGLSQGVRNTEDGVSLCQVADGALAEVAEMLHRITELSVQSANGTYTDEDRKAIQQEISQIQQEIERIGETTEFNERKIFGDDGQTTTAPPTTLPSLPSTVKVNRTLSVTISGQPITDRSAIYSLSADETTGITIDGQTYDWSQIKTAKGNTLADSVILAGDYSFTHKGINISINVSNYQTRDNISKNINGLNVEVSERVKQQIKAVSDITIKNGYLGKQYRSSYGDSINSSQYKIYADDNGIKVGNNTPYSWNDMGLDINNPKSGTYTFKDTQSSLKFTYKVEDGATKESLLKGLNNISINLKEGETSFYGPTMWTGNTRLKLYDRLINSTTNWCPLVYGANDYIPGVGETRRNAYFKYSKDSSGNPMLQYIGTDLTNPKPQSQYSFYINKSDLSTLQNINYANVPYDIYTSPQIRFVDNKGSTIYMYLDNADKGGSYNEILNQFDSGYIIGFGDSPCETSLWATKIVPNSIEDGNYAGTVYETYIDANKSKLVDISDEVDIQTDVQPTPDPTPIDKKEIGKWWIQSGSEAGQGMFLEIDRMNTTILGINDLDVSTVGGANHALDAVKGALEKVSSSRSKIGAQQNRLEHTIANELNVVENTTSAESRIRDTDMSKEMVAFSKDMILENVGQAMLAQANQSNQGVLSLLQ